ncbi:MAG TPA: TIGR02996 domain-containing protein [Gemmata sp.]
METAFLKCVTDDPDDTTARLVFADWLSEQDDPALTERGEFVHLQHALAANQVPPSERPGRVARQKELLGRHRERWDAPFRELIRGSEYRGGFAERVTLRAEQLVDGFADLIRLTPVVRVRLSGLTPDTVGFVAELEALAHLRELDFDRQPISAPVLRQLLGSPHTGRLRYLNLTRSGVGDEGVRALVASDVFRRLRYLNLSHAGVSAAGVRALVNAIYNRSPALEVLVLRGAPRVEPGTFPPVPPGLPFRLRQSLRAQIGLGPEPGDTLLARLHADRPALSNDLRQWVERLHVPGPWSLPRAIRELPLPAAVRKAFEQVCERRIVWRAQRSKTDIPAIPLDADGRTDLAGTLYILLRGSALADGGSAREARTLTDCLLDLYQRHEHGVLPPDGLTR